MAVTMAVWMLIVLVTTVVTLMLPERFASTARIKVEHDQTDIPGLSTPAMTSSYDPYFIQTECEVIQSEVILGRVVDTLTLKDEHIQELPLQQVWGNRYYNGVKLTRQEAMGILKAHLNLRMVRNTSLIEIGYCSERPDEAAKIANAVADTYLNHRIEQRKRLTSGGIEALKTRLDEESARVRAAESNVAYLRMEYGVADTTPQSDNAPADSETAEALRRITSLRVETEAQLAREEALLDSLKGMNIEDCARAIPAALSDTTLPPLLQQLAIAEQKIAVLKAQANPDPAELARISGEADELKARASRQTGALLAGLTAKVASLRKTVESLDKQKQAITRAAIERANRSQYYWEAKRHLEEMQRFRTVLLMKIASEKTDLDLPKSSMVEIVDPARPSARAKSPNTPLNIAMGTVIGGLVGFLLGGLLYLLQRRAHWMATRGQSSSRFSPPARMLTHIMVALLVGSSIGYLCATPTDFVSYICMNLFLILGVSVSAYIELARPRA